MKIKLKRGLSSNITALNLDNGEPAFCTDTGKLYIGDGTSNVLVNPTGGTADVATKLAVARAIALGGAVTGTVNFDGSANVTMTTSIGDDITNALGLKVDKVAGKDLSTNDYTTTDKNKLAGLGTASTKDTGTSSGNIPILDSNGKLASSTIPSVAITDTFIVASQAAMLALSAADIGDIAIRTDESKTYILQVAPASTLANWKLLATPTDTVTSVAGRTGAVTLSKTDVGLGNVINESKATMFTNAALTGTPTVPTAAKGTNTTQIASTAYVITALEDYLKTTDTIDGGTFQEGYYGK